jgi:LuxR family maltose regulon positive regulatory protein
MTAETTAIPLLRTKLHRPALPENLVPRDPLIEKLEQGLSNSLTLVTAPAGYGKSTAVSH